MEKSTIVYAAGVLLMTRAQPRQFLLMKHKDRWDLPKGHAEPGETAAETALRETHEETGLDRDLIELDPDFRYSTSYRVRYDREPDVEFEKRLTIFLAWIDRPRAIACSEHAGCQWFRWSPPHSIQAQAIDPLLKAVEGYLAEKEA
ncbi:MAG: NUDIX domain-containing protein [Pirellulaceae bacterium]